MSKPQKRIVISPPRTLTTAQLAAVRGGGIGTSPSFEDPLLKLKLELALNGIGTSPSDPTP